MFGLSIVFTFVGTLMSVALLSLIVNKGPDGQPDEEMQTHIDCLRSGQPDCHA